MQNAECAERFLVDIIPHIDVFTRSLVGSGQNRHIIHYPEISAAQLFENGTYTLSEKPIVLNADPVIFKAAAGVLAMEAEKLQKRYNVTTAPAYFRREGYELRYIPAVEITFAPKQQLLATIGKDYVQIYFQTQPALPQEHLPHESMLGACDADGNCIRFPPTPPDDVYVMPGQNARYKGAFDHKGVQVFEFVVERQNAATPMEKDGSKYVIGAPLKLQHDLVSLISDSDSLMPAEGGVVGAHPPYHLATFLNILN